MIWAYVGMALAALPAVLQMWDEYQALKEIRKWG